MNTISILSAVRRIRMLVGFGLILGTTLRGQQQVESVASFTGDCGTAPGDIVQSSNGNFYGTTATGGKNGFGTVFMLASNQNLTTLAAFTGENGARPCPRLVTAKDGCLYGATEKGGDHDLGTVYRILPNNTLQTLASFDASNGSDPRGDLVVEDDGTVYGCTESGGANNQGTIFALGQDHHIKTLVNFSSEIGIYPEGLARGSDGKYYGATCSGGHCNSGTAFSVNSKGELETICSFDTSEGNVSHCHLERSSDGSFYGTTFNGGKNDVGTIYSISTKGVLQHLQSFNQDTGFHPGPDLVEWSNGYFYVQQLFDNIQVKSSAVQWIGQNFCGTTTDGGEHGFGTVYRVTADGRLATIASFTGVQGKCQGAAPNSLIVAIDGNLYGTTSSGGPENKGTIFRLLVAPVNLAANAYGRMPQSGLPNFAAPPIVSH